MQRLLVCFLLALCLVSLASASSHGEAPNQVKMPVTDVSDVYAFMSYESGRDGFVTLLANFAPLQDGFNGPNYHALDDKFFYEFNIDTTGDGVPEKTFQFTIVNELTNAPNGIQLNIGGTMQSIPLKTAGSITATDQTYLNYLEFYRLSVVSNGVSSSVSEVGSGSTTFKKPFDYSGHKTFPDYATYANSYIYDVNFPGCATAGKLFVGQRAEPFSINIGPIFDLINFIPLPPTEFPNGITDSPSNNQLALKDVTTFAIEIEKSCLGATTAQPIVGVWVTSRPKHKANRPKSPQKSRLGNPLVNELIIGLPDKDKWSRRTPAQDGQLNKYIAYPTLPAIIDLLFRPSVNSVLGTSYASIAPTNFPRKDLVAIFLTGVPNLNALVSPSTNLVEMLRLNTAIAPVAASAQSSYGVFGNDVAGFPNGRRPGDDVVDIALRAMMGKVCYIGLGVCNPSDAVIGNLSYTDGAPIAATDFGTSFPYLNIPITSS